MNKKVIDLEPAGVVILHGMLVSSWTTIPLARSLERSGFSVLNCSYRWTGQSIEQMIDQLLPRVQQFHDSLPENATLNLVGHSLGAILCRMLVETSQISKLNRAVHIAPPHRGSFVATRVGPYVRRLIPSMTELSDAPDSYINQRSAMTPIPTGIIEANPDFVIRPAATRLENSADHIVVAGPHGLTVVRKVVFRQTAHFIRHGHFDHSDKGLIGDDRRG